MAMARPSGRLCKLACLLACVGVAGAGSAAAGVIEIRPDGSVVEFQGPAVFKPEAATPITPPRPASAARSLARQPPENIASLIKSASEKYHLSPDLVAAIAWQESRFRPSAVSPKGAIGVMQLMPATAAELGVDPADLSANIDGGAAYLRRMLDRFDGDLEKAIAAYNAGPGAVARHGGPPPFAETRGYLDAIFARLADLSTPAAAGHSLQDRP